jgi:hypothetical protein
MLKKALRCLMLGRALVVWCLLLVIAILNGALRVAWLIPRFGETRGHIASTVSLSAAIVLLAAYTIGWIRPRTWGETWIIGACWESRSRSSFSVVTFCSGVPGTRY